MQKVFNIYILQYREEETHLWPFSKSKSNLKSDRVNLVAPAIECLLYLPDVRGIQYKQGWPGPKIQMYYGCPWRTYSKLFTNFHVSWDTLYLNFGLLFHIRQNDIFNLFDTNIYKLCTICFFVLMSLNISLSWKKNIL